MSDFERDEAERPRQPHIKERAIGTTVYLLPEDHRRLKMLTAGEETTFQALVMDALDAALMQRGEAPLTRWETRRKVRG